MQPPADDQMRTQAQEFFITEYKCLRDEISNWLNDVASMQRYFLIGTAAIYVWLAAVQFDLVASPDEPAGPPAVSVLKVLTAMWFIPVVLAILGGLRALGIAGRLAEIGGYLGAVEKEWRMKVLGGVLQTEKGCCGGWETFMGPGLGNLTVASYFFWGLSIIFTLLIALWITFLVAG